MSRIPTIDISVLNDPATRATCVAQIMAVCESFGFLSIIGTGVADGPVAEMRATVGAIFAMDDAPKRDQASTRQNYRGYVPFCLFAQG